MFPELTRTRTRQNTNTAEHRNTEHARTRTRQNTGKQNTAVFILRSRALRSAAFCVPIRSLRERLRSFCVPGALRSAAFCVLLRSLRERLRSAAFQGSCVLLRSAFCCVLDPAFCCVLRSRLAAFCCVLGSCVPLRSVFCRVLAEHRGGALVPVCVCVVAVCF